MVRENLTHRDSDYRDTKDSVLLARAWLESKAQTVKRFDSLFKSKRGVTEGRGHSSPDSSRSIQKFLSKQGKTISHETRYLTG